MKGWLFQIQVGMLGFDSLVNAQGKQIVYMMWGKF